MVSMLGRQTPKAEQLKAKQNGGPVEMAGDQVSQDENEDTEDQEVSEKTPIHWLDKNLVTIKNLPLSPELLDNTEVIYETSKGNQTILDLRYALYRIGYLLSELGFTPDDLSTERLNEIANEALRYYCIDYETERLSVEREKAKAKQDSIIAKTIPNLRQIALAMGQTYKLKWTDEQWIAHLTENS